MKRAPLGHVLFTSVLLAIAGCENMGGNKDGGGTVKDRQQTQTTNPDGSATRQRTQTRETPSGATVKETQTEKREVVKPGQAQRQTNRRPALPGKVRRRQPGFFELAVFVNGQNSHVRRRRLVCRGTGCGAQKCSDFLLVGKREECRHRATWQVAGAPAEGLSDGLAGVNHRAAGIGHQNGPGCHIQGLPRQCVR